MLIKSLPHNQHREIFHHPLKIPCALCSHFFPLPLLPGKHWSTLCQNDPFLFVLEFHIKWDLSVSVLFLASLAQSNVFEIHPCLCMYQLFIHFYCWVFFHCINIFQFVHLLSAAEYLLFPVWGSYSYSCYECLYASPLWRHVFSFLIG